MLKGHQETNMRFFRLGKRQLTDDELREQLFDLVAHAQQAKLAQILQEQTTRIHTLIPSWKTIPPALRRDPIAIKRWVEGVIGIAAGYEALGDGALIQQLIGDSADNLLTQSEERLTNAQAAFDTQKYTDTIRIAQDAITALDGLSGSGVAHYQARMYGLMGAAYFRIGDTANAIRATLQAKAMCEQSGDQEGVAIYTRNLQHIAAT